MNEQFLQYFFRDIVLDSNCFKIFSVYTNCLILFLVALDLI